ncbi:ABC transporter permease [Paraburkholderia sp. GAS348]|uniref:ABC transporter permease n=1 Tax=Paraburkholderia sp. GAS348 TaxID=3035132 RepID=UPI003D1F5387
MPSIVAASGILVVAAMLGVPGFASSGNIVNIGLQVSILLMIAMPMTLVILSEGLDLSVGALLSLCAVVFAQALGLGWGIALALCASVAVGMLTGLFNGALIAKLGLPPFVVTLGTLGIAHGVALVLTDGNAVVVANPSVAQLYAWTLLGIPLPVIFALLAYAFTHLLLYHTRFGTYVFAIGGNRDALLLAGIKAKVFHIAIYVFGGLMVGLAALVLVGRMNSAEPNSAIGMEFDAIAAVVLGGTSFERGEGWLFGTVMGVLTIGVLRNALNLLGIESSLQVVSVGMLVLLVVVIDSVRKSRVNGAKA